MTQLAQLIYNTFLRISRSKQGQPFKYRQNFDDFEKNEHYVSVMKLENFFKRFPHIKIEDFFTAPYEVYTERTYYSLDFYLSPKAIKVYTIWNKARCNANPDSNVQIEFIIKSFTFIYNFCIENKLTFDNYITHKTGLLPSFLIHLKEHNISMYVLFGWPDFEDVYERIPESERELCISHLYDDIKIYRTRFMQSTEAKKLVKKGVELLENHQKTHGTTSGRE